MSSRHRFAAGCRALFRRKALERDLDDEIRSYLDLATEQHVAAGMSRDEARRRARAAMGSIDVVKEQVRDALWETMVDNVWQDVRYALRGLRRSPGFAAVVVLTLALGIGANTAIFSIVHGVLLKPLPYAGSDRLVRVFENLPPRPPGDAVRRESPLPLSDLDAFRGRSTALSHAGVFMPALVTMANGNGPVRLGATRLSASLFAMVGAAPVIGRTLDARDERVGGDPVVLLNESVWERDFGRDGTVLGRVLDIDGKGHTIVGVMPRAFAFPDGRPDIWLPLPMDGGRIRLPLLARIKDGVAIEAAAAETASLLAQLRPEAPAAAAAAQTSPRFILVGVQELLAAPVRSALLVLAAAVGFVLLIACVNVANLLLARAASRQAELATRLALGASSGRLIRQALTESTICALLGGAAGTLLAAGGIWLLHRLAAAPLDLGPAVALLPRLDEIRLDATVLGFTLAVSLAAGFMFGAAPAARSSWATHHAPYVPASRANPRGRLQSALVVAQIGMATMLLIGSVLLIRSFINLTNVRPGYEPQGVLTFKVSLPPARTDGQLRTFGEDLAGRLASIPGVRAAGYAESLPLVRVARLGWLGTTPEMPRDPDAARGPGATGRSVSVRVVSRRFFEAMGSRIVSGRSLADGDGAGRPQAMVINQTLARMAFGRESPLGTQLFLVGSVTFDPRRLRPSGPAPVPWEIVGIVEDVRQASLDQEPGPEVFVDFRQLPGPSGPPGVSRYFAVRIGGNPAAIVPEVRGLIRQADAQALVENVAPMTRLVSGSIARQRLYAVLMGLFGLVALTLAGVGIYGVMSYAVSQRTREIGIRMALGARHSSVLGLVVGRSLILTALGIAAGLAAAAAVARTLTTLLFGLTPLDPLTFLAVPLLFAMVSAAAAFVPARRAATIDPLRALRAE